MLGAEGVLANCEAAAIQRLRLRVVAEVLVKPGQIGETGSDARMLGAEGFLVDREAAAVQRLGLRVVAEGGVEVGQVVEAGATSGCSGPRAFFRIARAR